jgi:quinol monooxygenase YgiN
MLKGDYLMSIVVLFEGKVKEGSADALEKILTNIFPGTRSYEGCGGITAAFDAERKSVIFVEHWDSQSHYEKYLGWRKETGVLDDILAQLKGEPSIRFFRPSSA